MDTEIYFPLLKIAVEASIKGGLAIMSVYGREDVGLELKDDRSPLTLADRQSNEVIQRFLEPTGIPVISEESLLLPWSERNSWSSCWIVDPLDGTREFVNRNGEFTVNIALVSEGRPLLGVVYAPCTGEIFFGGAKTGAFMDTLTGSQALTLSTSEVLSGASPLKGISPEYPPLVVVASRSHMNPETEQYIENLKKNYPELTTISRGSSLKICMVAAGFAHVYPRFGPTMEWDTAAGHAIAVGAGCRMYDPRSGAELVYNKENLKNPWFMVDRIL